MSRKRTDIGHLDLLLAADNFVYDLGQDLWDY
jgi:hypothetical protein